MVQWGWSNEFGIRSAKYEISVYTGQCNEGLLICYALGCYCTSNIRAISIGNADDIFHCGCGGKVYSKSEFRKEYGNSLNKYLNDFSNNYFEFWQVSIRIAGINVDFTGRRGFNYVVVSYTNSNVVYIGDNIYNIMEDVESRVQRLISRK